MTLTLNSPVIAVKGVGKKYQQVFSKYRIFTVTDLLLRFPVLYIDFSRVKESVEIGNKNLYLVTVRFYNLSRIYGRRLSILKVKGKIGDDDVELVFFNKPYLLDTFRDFKQVYIFGAFEQKNGACTTSTPLLFTSPDSIPLIPLYDKIGTIKSGSIKKIITNALVQLEDDYECLPQSVLEKYDFTSIVETLRELHCPTESTSLEDARQLHLKMRFIYTEFLEFQLELQYVRSFFRKVRRTNYYPVYRPPCEHDVASDHPPIKAISEQRHDILKDYLPFELTPDQWKACSAIWADLEKDVTMQRLLQGDVGSGKTIVAFIALLSAVFNRYQGAFLAPTEILARQHFTNGKTFFKSHRIGILTGSTSIKERKRILKELAEGTIDIIFGTHALLNEEVKFNHLSMVVIDEQHRFGVSQRAALYYKGKAVDLLVTTATPIPRTMLLSLYNDLAVSVIKTKPAGRLPIKTKIVAPERRDEFYKWLREKIEKGEKVYIILPLIEVSEHFTELRSIESEESYFKKVFKGIPIGLVSGRLSVEEKDSAIGDFAEGRTKVLISTTVIEVGIDVRDATYMVIENADRYGLAQLHQLRGRVGRGDKQSFCYLFSSSTITAGGMQRLDTMAATDDGFKIAETDLKMRGGGIISGMEQAGYLDFNIGNLRDHYPVFEDARRDAAQILADKSLHTEFITQRIEKVNERLKDINFS